MDTTTAERSAEMCAVLALAGDTMLGRGVGERLAEVPPASLLGPRLRAVLAEADATVLNLECCISDRGSRWPAAGKPFFFRAPPVAVEVLHAMGVRAVTLANNHALDYGPDALADTLSHLTTAGIRSAGAGADLAAARQPLALDVAGEPVVVVAFTDHPADFAAGPLRPGVAHADLRHGVPDWVLQTVADQRERAATLVTPHWGPNMVTEPVPAVRRAALALAAVDPALVAGHSAHVFHGVSGRVLFDMGDLIDDYARDPLLRNDIGLLWLTELDGGSFRWVQAVPLRLRFAYTELADGDDAAWARRRLREACAAFGTPVSDDADGRLHVSLS